LIVPGKVEILHPARIIGHHFGWIFCALMTACMVEFTEILLSLALAQRIRVSRVALSQE
jgi:hypothetical protein